MGCGKASKIPQVRTIPKEFGTKEYRGLEEKKKVPAIGGLPHEVKPEGAAKIGWYNLKEDQMVVTKATAFPYGFDGTCATMPAECKLKDGEIPPTWDDEKMNEFVVDAVIADENGKRYVNVLELAAVRKDGCTYVIKGRIERSSWRDQDDSWANPRRKDVWDKTFPQHWCAEPVKAEVAQGSAGYQSRVAPQENPTTRPAQSFEEYRDAFMVKFQEACVKEHEAHGAEMKARAEQRAADRMTATFTISLDGEVVMEIDKGKFSTKSGAMDYEKWSKDGNVLRGPSDTWRVDLHQTLTMDGSTPQGYSRDWGWKIEKDHIGRQKGRGYHCQEFDENVIYLKDNKVEIQPSGKTLIIEPKEWIDHLGKPKEAVPMDTKTLAFALVAMGMIDENDAGNDKDYQGN